MRTLLVVDRACRPSGFFLLLVLVSRASLAMNTGPSGGGFPLVNHQPSLAIGHIVATQGLFPARNGVGAGSGASPFLGEIRMFAGNFAPQGWSLADGQTLTINNNQALFSLLGSTYGGDGRTNFALPDLRGRSVIQHGSGPGFTSRLGDPLGDAFVKLTPDHLPPHGHGLPGGLTTGNTGGGVPVDNFQPSLPLNFAIATQGLFPSRAAVARDADADDHGSGAGGSSPFMGEIRIFANNFAPRGWALTEGQLLPIAQNAALFSLLGNTFGGDGRTEFALPDLRGRTAIHVGRGPGLNQRNRGEQVGAHQITLSPAQLPSHVHPLTEGGMTEATGGGMPFSNMQPSLAVNYIIALRGLFPSRNAEPAGTGATEALGAGSGIEPFIGEIRMFAGTFAPRGWAFADGQLLSINENDALFSVIGTTFGGDGRTTFALPDLRGRTAVHFGAVPGQRPILPGARFGTEQHTLEEANMPRHFHSLPAETTADFDGDGDVDEDDYQRWVDSFPALQGATPSQGDTNGDGAVEGKDFLNWQLLYGSKGQQATAIPEPSAIALVMVTLWGPLTSRRVARRWRLNA